MNKITATLVTGTVAVVALAGSFFGVSAALAGPLSPEQQAVGSLTEPPEYDVNPAGETFGAASPSVPDEQWPDLVQVVADTGEVGFVRRDDLTGGDSPKTLAEAAAASKVAEQLRWVPVYASDGKTEVGKFPVGGTSSTGDEK